MWIYNATLSYVQNVEDAEEIVQDSIIAALENLDRFKSESSLKTWVYRIAMNKAKDFLRYKSRQKRSATVLSIHQENQESTFIEPGNFIHPGIQLESKEQMDLLFAAINSLVEAQKTVLILTKLDQLPLKEVADILDTSVKAVESLLSRAKSNLKKILEEQGIETSTKRKS